MRTIENANSNERWVFSPIRESFSQNVTSTEIEQTAKEIRKPFVNLSLTESSVEASYSAEAGYDFAKKYLREFKENNSLYIQSIAETGAGEVEFAIVLIINGQIQRDAIIKLDDLNFELSQMAESISANKTPKMIIREYGCKSVISKDLLLTIALSPDAITTLTAPLTDSLSPTLTVELGELRYALKVLKQKPISKTKLLIGVLMTAAMLFYIFQPEEAKEIVVTKDPYKKYREVLLKSQPQVGNRMAQAYNIQLLIEKLPGWKLTKVVHSKTQTPQFYVSPLASSSERQLQIFAKANNLVVMQDKTGNILTTTGANIPVYQDESQVEVYSLSSVYQLLTDSVASMIPEAALTFIDYRKIDSTQNEWTTMRAVINFKSASNADLLKIKSITADLPVTLEIGAYQVESGRLSGSIIIQIHGVEI